MGSEMCIRDRDDLGDFVEGFGWLTGLNVYEVNDKIYDNLKDKSKFID